MDRALAELTSPAAALGLAAAVAFGPVLYPATWPSLARGRPGGTAVASIAVGLLGFLFARLLGVPAGG
jgi:hypothetical protein